MITRVFKLTEASAKYLGSLPKEDGILVVKSEHKVRQMFIDVLESALYHRADTRPAFEEIAAGCDGAYWDLYDIMGGAGSMDAWVNANLARTDRIHFTPDGYTILGNLLFNALMDAYTASAR